MDNYVEHLIDAGQSYAPCYMDFLKRFDHKKKQVFVFYEGDEDSCFYKLIIQRIIGFEYELEELIAGSKRNVLDLQSKFDWTQYNNKQIIFIVDRDLSFWLNDNVSRTNVFVTDGYSVENYLINSECFKTWLVSFEGFARAKKEEIIKMVAEFERCIELFNDMMKRTMAIAIIAQKNKMNIQLSNISIIDDESFKLGNDGQVCFSIKQEKIEEKFMVSTITESDIKRQITIIDSNIEHYYVRGKWILRFMVGLGEFMRLNSNVFAPSLNKPRLKKTCGVDINKTFSVLAPHYICGSNDSFNKFIRETFCEYIMERD